MIGHVDSSGMRIKMVSKLRKFDAGVMELGLEYTDKMAIPPGQVGFPLSGYCISECTDLVIGFISIYFPLYIEFIYIILFEFCTRIHLYTFKWRNSCFCIITISHLSSTNNQYFISCWC